MFKILPAAFTVFFLLMCTIIQAQILHPGPDASKIDLLPKKKGTLSILTTSGNGANQCSLVDLTASSTSICIGSSVTITESSAGGGGNFSSSPILTWYHNDDLLSSEQATRSTITVTQPGLYRLVETSSLSSNSCWVEILITSTAPIAIPENTTLASGGTVVLTAPDTLSNGASVTSFQWYDGNGSLSGETNKTYTASQSGNYYVQVANENGCAQNSDVITVNVVAEPASSTFRDDHCINGRLYINSDASSALVPDSITWYKDNVADTEFNNKGIVVAGGNGSGNALNQLNQPYGIFLDADKNIYVADYENDRIVKWSADGSPDEVVVDNISNINGSKPNDVFVDAQQHLSITTDHGIIITPLNPVLDNIYRKSFNGFNSSVGNNLAPITGDNNSNIFVCNTSGSYIEKWNPYTSTQSEIGNGSFDRPTGIFLDTINNFLYVIEKHPSQDDKYNYPMKVVRWDMSTNTVADDVAGSDYPQSNFEISWADQLTVDVAGNVYVADTLGNNIQIWTDFETEIILASGFHPKGMKLDSEGNLYVVDATNNRVLEFFVDAIQSSISEYLNYGSTSSLPGTVVAGSNGIGSGLNQLNHPEGIFIDADKNIYIADNGNDRIVKWAAGATSGEVILDSVSRFTGYKNNLKDVWIDKNQNLFFSDSGYVIHVPIPFPDQIKLKAANAWGLTGDANSNLYISENGGIEKWNPYTNADSTFGAGSINEPNGICRDAAGNIYVGDNLTDSEYNYYGRIMKFAPGGTGEVVVGSNYSQIGANSGIAIDAAGNLFIADMNNERVLVWKKNAAAPATIASGYRPWGIKLDSDGYIYVADQTNNRVVKYPPMVNNFINNVTPGVYKAEVHYPGGYTETTNEITITDCALALRFLNFTASLQTNGVLLRWQTGDEINTDYFKIERSTDGIHYSQIGVAPANNKSGTNNYSYMDMNIPAAGNELYYRLKEIDKDGNFTYSKIVTVVLDEQEQGLRISPNPVHDLLTININNVTSPAAIVVTDANGRRLIKKNIPVASFVISLNTANLAAGAYFLQVITNGKVQQQKFIKY